MGNRTYSEALELAKSFQMSRGPRFTGVHPGSGNSFQLVNLAVFEGMPVFFLNVTGNDEDAVTSVEARLPLGALGLELEGITAKGEDLDEVLTDICNQMDMVNADVETAIAAISEEDEREYAARQWRELMGPNALRGPKSLKALADY